MPHKHRAHASIEFDRMLEKAREELLFSIFSERIPIEVDYQNASVEGIVRGGTVRALVEKAFRQLGIQKVDALRDFSEEDFLSLPGCGSATLEEIKKFAHFHRIKLKKS